MRPPSTTAAAVSSHEVSMPRMRTVSGPAAEPLDDRHAADRPLDPRKQTPVRRLAHLVRPHDERVLAGVRVVALAHADRGEAETLVHLLRATVRQPDLER